MCHSLLKYSVNSFRIIKTEHLLLSVIIIVKLAVTSSHNVCCCLFSYNSMSQSIYSLDLWHIHLQTGVKDLQNELLKSLQKKKKKILRGHCKWTLHVLHTLCVLWNESTIQRDLFLHLDRVHRFVEIELSESRRLMWKNGLLSENLFSPFRAPSLFQMLQHHRLSQLEAFFSAPAVNEISKGSGEESLTTHLESRLCWLQSSWKTTELWDII